MEVQIFELENKLNDDVLKLVSRFIGYKVHPTAEILKDRIAYERLFNPSLSSERAVAEFLGLKERVLDISATDAYYRLVKKIAVYHGGGKHLLNYLNELKSGW